MITFQLIASRRFNYFFRNEPFTIHHHRPTHIYLPSSFLSKHYNDGIEYKLNGFMFGKRTVNKFSWNTGSISSASRNNQPLFEHL